MPHTLPWLLEESLSHSREVEMVLILTLQRKPSPLTSSCPKQCWCGSRVMKGLPRSFDPGASWVTPALPGLRNAGPHWLCFLFPLIFTASSGSCAYSVLEFSLAKTGVKDQISKTKRSMYPVVECGLVSPVGELGCCSMLLNAHIPILLLL